MSLNDFHFLCKLGDGAYSQVFKVKRVIDGQEYALKKVKMVHLTSKEKENALNEVRILASILHPGIIAYKEAFFESNTLCIVMEYANNGDMLQKINEHSKKCTHFTEKEIWNFFVQMVRGLKSLHDLNILHRDLKCANIFLNKDGTCKLGDLNVSKIAKKGLLYTQTGTPYYASPEVWKDKPYDAKSDMWSLGCVLYEMVALKPPFTGNDMKGLYRCVLKGLYPRISSQYTAGLAEVIKSLLQVNPKDRPTCDELLNSPFLTDNIGKTLTALETESLLQNGSLLNTIKVPKNLTSLNSRLPKANYNPPKYQRKNSDPKFENDRERRKIHTTNATRILESINNPLSYNKGKDLATIEENVAYLRQPNDTQIPSTTPTSRKDPFDDSRKKIMKKMNLPYHPNPTPVNSNKKNVNPPYYNQPPLSQMQIQIIPQNHNYLNHNNKNVLDTDHHAGKGKKAFESNVPSMQELNKLPISPSNAAAFLYNNAPQRRYLPGKVNAHKQKIDQTEKKMIKLPEITPKRESNKANKQFNNEDHKALYQKENHQVKSQGYLKKDLNSLFQRVVENNSYNQPIQPNYQYYSNLSPPNPTIINPIKDQYKPHEDNMKPRKPSVPRDNNNGGFQYNYSRPQYYRRIY